MLGSVFTATAYSIDWNVALAQPIWVYRNDKKRKTTIRELLEPLAGRPFTVESVVFGLQLQSEQGIVAVDLVSTSLFSATILKAIGDLVTAAGADAAGAGTTLCFFDHALLPTDAALDQHTFFAVFKGKIIHDHIEIRRDINQTSDEELSKLLRRDSEEEVPDGQLRVWYQEFYERTRVGQLVAREPSSTLFYYRSPQRQLESIQEKLSATRRLLWVLSGVTVLLLFLLLLYR